MKRIHDLTEAELVALTDDEAQKFVDLECAVEGVIMLPPAPGPEPEKLETQPTTKAYSIGGVLMLDAGHAAKILELMTSTQLYTTDYISGDYKTKRLVPLEAGSYKMPKIEQEVYFSQEEWDKIKDSYMAYKTRYDTWKSHDNLYKSALKERAECTKVVWNAIEVAQDSANRKQRLRENFAGYLKLAEGNETVAWNFLTKAYYDDTEEFPELKKELVNAFNEISKIEEAPE